MSGAVCARFDLAALAAEFPESADTLLRDRYLTDAPDASARLFRVYQGTPAHYHVYSDEYLFVLSGRGTFWMEHESATAEFQPGQLLYFRRGVVHALPRLLAGPVVFYAVDVPRRRPEDIVFVAPRPADAAEFIAAIG